MKTEKEIKEWLKTNMVSMADMLKICRFLQNVDITIPTMTVFNTSKKTTYHHFVKWFNEPNEKVLDEVTETPWDVYNAFIERCKTGVDVLLRPDDVKMGEKFIILPHLIYDNSYQQDFEINGKELKVTNPKFPIGTKVVRKGKPNGNVYTIKKYFTEGRKGVKGRYLVVADDGSFMCGVRESKLEKCEPKDELYEIGDIVLARAPYGNVIGELVHIDEMGFDIKNTVILKGDDSLGEKKYGRSGGSLDFLICKVDNLLLITDYKNIFTGKPKSAIDEFNEKQEVRIKRGKDGAFNVYVGDFCTDFLSYDEMLGTVAALLTPPDIRERKCLHWLKTKEQHLAGRSISPELREEMGITDEEYEVICNRE